MALKARDFYIISMYQPNISLDLSHTTQIVEFSIDNIALYKKL